MGKVANISQTTKPCYQCAHCLRSATPMVCLRRAGLQECRLARLPGTACGVNGVLWHPGDPRGCGPLPPEGNLPA